MAEPSCWATWFIHPSNIWNNLHTSLFCIPYRPIRPDTFVDPSSAMIVLPVRLTFLLIILSLVQPFNMYKLLLFIISTVSLYSLYSSIITEHYVLASTSVCVWISHIARLVLCTWMFSDCYYCKSPNFKSAIAILVNLLSTLVLTT